MGLPAHTLTTQEKEIGKKVLTDGARDPGSQVFATVIATFYLDGSQAPILPGTSGVLTPIERIDIVPVWSEGPQP